MAMRKHNIVATVDEYMDALPEKERAVLQKIRTIIKSAAPKAEEVISYQIPTYKYFGALVHFAAFKNHCSFFGVSKSLFDTFKGELEPFKISGKTIHFTVDNPLPATVVRKLVKARLKENEYLQWQNKKNKTIVCKTV